MTGRLARRYARALLELARAEGTLEASGVELGRGAAAFAEPRLRAVVLSPAIDGAVRLRIAGEVIASLGISPTVANLLRLLAAHDRLRLVDEVARAYDALVDDELGRARVLVRSAVALTASERSELVALARRLTGRREILLTTEVDPELLGGVVLAAGATVYDGSIRTQLLRCGREVAERGA